MEAMVIPGNMQNEPGVGLKELARIMETTINHVAGASGQMEMGTKAMDFAKQFLDGLVQMHDMVPQDRDKRAMEYSPILDESDEDMADWDNTKLGKELKSKIGGRRLRAKQADHRLLPPTAPMPGSTSSVKAVGEC